MVDGFASARRDHTLHIDRLFEHNQLMHCFGDESGDLRSLLTGDCEVCVYGVVAGDYVNCGRCAKQAVRNINDIPEAKWNALTDTQKRRFIDCLRDCDGVQYGYAEFDRKKLHTLNNYHHLYQEVSFPPDWDLALAGYAYGEIMFELGATEERRAMLDFDRVASRSQSEAIVEHVTEFVPDVAARIQSSRQAKTVQTADCLAGAIAEDIRKETDWIEQLGDPEMVEGHHAALIQLEQQLTEYDTVP